MSGPEEPEIAHGLSGLEDRPPLNQEVVISIGRVGLRDVERVPQFDFLTSPEGSSIGLPIDLLWKLIAERDHNEIVWVTVLAHREDSPERPANVVPEGVREFIDGRLKVDYDRRRIIVDDRPRDLSPREFELLSYLTENKGRIVPRSEILDWVWGTGYMGGEKTIDVHVKRLRDALEAHRNTIRTKRSIGYMFDEPTEARG